MTVVRCMSESNIVASYKAHFKRYYSKPILIWAFGERPECDGLSGANACEIKLLSSLSELGPYVFKATGALSCSNELLNCLPCHISVPSAHLRASFAE